ncbi:MAG TPA: DUF4065 domain-containing protein [Methanocorpusculum sp.]|nr:DUF4065 domain-containing protein [Methanocorpusculum sp.]
MRAIDVANFFVDLSEKSGENDLTKMKLIKLVYFAQALHLAKNKTPLFDEEVLAWDYGPVIPSVFHEFNGYQREIIEKTTDSYDLSNFTSEDIDFLIDIEMNYGKFSAIELSRQSHVKGGPWDAVYRKGMNAVIPKEMMAEYYSDKPFKTFTIDLSKVKPIGRRDKDGNLILPAEMYSPDDDIYDDVYAECRS